MTKPNEMPPPVHQIVDDRIAMKYLRVFRFIAFGVMVQTLVVCYLAFWQPSPMIDGKLLRFSNNLMDQEARLVQLERENMTLFRMLRNENEQRGLTPDRLYVPVAPVPLPPGSSPVKIIGDAPGDLPGDMF
ncbi:MAG: hypothetical protein FWD31_15035 [Planctomycetaceae bacterium]|nr:hypothetical protein [Planctomycetaceae bacterium]